LDVSGADEATLVEQARRGERTAFDQLVLRHQQMVFAVTMRMLGDRHEAQEVAQDVFVRAFQSLGGFRGDAKLSTWLVSITMNLCRNRRRWWARRRRIIVASLDDRVEIGEETVEREAEDPSPSPAHLASARERDRYLMDALQSLDEASRSVVVLRDLQGYSYEEIAQALRCRVGTVKSRLNRARLKLRSLLDGKL
jgi:RNA polymerase sigma-70 factor (ECF subfamily)